MANRHNTTPQHRNRAGAPAYPASNLLASLHLLLPCALAAGGLWLTLRGEAWYLWLAGQAALGIFFFQCFILLHEAGHGSFFAGRPLNRMLGHLCGFLSAIPFRSWESIHALHHRWTGWRDKDPTTEGTVAPAFGPLVAGIVNVAWWIGFPLFTLGYRIGNYWSHGKLRRHLPARKMKGIMINQAILVLCYAVLFVLWGGWIVASLGLAYLISLVISDLFILSQHSHIDIPLAAGRDVRPITYAEQIPYTRSLRVQRTLARLLLLNFNLHELHHARPGVPAYHLGRITDPTPNTRPFWAFMVRSRAMKGVDFVFSTTRKSGVEL